MPKGQLNKRYTPEFKIKVVKLKNLFTKKQPQNSIYHKEIKQLQTESESILKKTKKGFVQNAEDENQQDVLIAEVLRLYADWGDCMDDVNGLSAIPTFCHTVFSIGK